MGFQFQCPQGHLLQAEPNQVGQQSCCPLCGTPFIIPAPVGAVVSQHPLMPFANAAAGIAPQMPHATPQMGPLPPIDLTHAVRTRQSASGVELPASPSSQLLHIPCPSGHELEVPTDMLDQDALCPTCQVQFRLRAKDSLEHKRRQAEAMDRRQEKLGQAWLNWAVIIAVAVVVGLVVMIIVRANR